MIFVIFFSDLNHNLDERFKSNNLNQTTLHMNISFYHLWLLCV